MSKRLIKTDCRNINSKNVCLVNSFSDEDVLCVDVPENNCLYDGKDKSDPPAPQPAKKDKNPLISGDTEGGII